MSAAAPEFTPGGGGGGGGVPVFQPQQASMPHQFVPGAPGGMMPTPQQFAMMQHQQGMMGFPQPGGFQPGPMFIPGLGMMPPAGQQNPHGDA
jgi:hypothetical protein